MTKKVLFVCSRNQWRSPTGAKVWHEQYGFDTRSAGTSPRAQRSVSSKDIQWADLILVMEQKHKDRLQASFQAAVRYKTIVVLDIPDDYRFMAPELIEIFEVIAQQYI